MTINKTLDGNVLTIALEGRLDTASAPELENMLKAELKPEMNVIFDMKQLDYVSSAGLRVLLFARKNSESIKVINANDIVMQVFDVTGFTHIIPIE